MLDGRGGGVLRPGVSVDTLEGLVDVEPALDVVVEPLACVGPVSPSCWSANEFILEGFDMLDGRGGGVLGLGVVRDI